MDEPAGKRLERYECGKTDGPASGEQLVVKMSLLGAISSGDRVKSLTDNHKSITERPSLPVRANTIGVHAFPSPIGQTGWTLWVDARVQPDVPYSREDLLGSPTQAYGRMDGRTNGGTDGRTKERTDG